VVVVVRSPPPPRPPPHIFETKSSTRRVTTKVPFLEPPRRADQEYIFGFPQNISADLIEMWPLVI
jgi:hypothetical protein